MWEQHRGIVAGGRVVVPRLRFPGYAGVAAAEARDGHRRPQLISLPAAADTIVADQRGGRGCARSERSST